MREAPLTFQRCGVETHRLWQNRSNAQTHSFTPQILTFRIRCEQHKLHEENSQHINCFFQCSLWRQSKCELYDPRPFDRHIQQQQTQKRSSTSLSRAPPTAGTRRPTRKVNLKFTASPRHYQKSTFTRILQLQIPGEARYGQKGRSGPSPTKRPATDGRQNPPARPLNFLSAWQPPTEKKNPWCMAPLVYMVWQEMPL